METELLASILPDLILDHFAIVTFKRLGDISTNKMIFEIHLNEKNSIHEEENKADFESKRFLPSSRVQDFPIRGKAVYLLIRKHRWRNKTTREKINNDYSYVAKGVKLTAEIADFLKGTGRDPRRYDQ